MKKIISILVCIALIIILIPERQASAEVSSSQGTIESGQEYYGVAPVNAYGNNIPVRYELPVAQNSIIRVILYTQQDCDSCLYINSEDSPYYEEGNYGNLTGSNITAVGDFYNPVPNVYGISSYCITADMRNTREYTEMFGDIAKGNYYIVITGSSYRFKIILEPLKFSGEAGITNYSKETAATYSVGNEQDGVLITNGIVNGDFIKWEKTTDGWYKFTADKGKYHLYFESDGFFQGTASVLDASGYPFNGSIKTEAFFKFANDIEYGGTFDDHISRANVFSTDFEILENGTYYININRRTWTSGSYQFKIVSDAVEEGTVTPGDDTADDYNDEVPLIIPTKARRMSLKK